MQPRPPTGESRRPAARCSCRSTQRSSPSCALALVRAAGQAGLSRRSLYKSDLAVRPRTWRNPVILSNSGSRPSTPRRWRGSGWRRGESALPPPLQMASHRAARPPAQAHLLAAAGPSVRRRTRRSPPAENASAEMITEARPAWRRSCAREARSDTSRTPPPEEAGRSNEGEARDAGRDASASSPPASMGDGRDEDQRGDAEPLAVTSCCNGSRCGKISGGLPWPQHHDRRRASRPTDATSVNRIDCSRQLPPGPVVERVTGAVEPGAQRLVCRWRRNLSAGAAAVSRPPPRGCVSAFCTSPAARLRFGPSTRRRFFFWWPRCAKVSNVPRSPPTGDKDEEREHRGRRRQRYMAGDRPAVVDEEAADRVERHRPSNSLIPARTP